MAFQQGHLIERFNETATSNGTLTLVHNSAKHQILTGTQSHTIVLPDATTMTAGISFIIINESTGILTVEYDDNTTLTTIQPNQTAQLLVRNISTSNGVWVVNLGSAAEGLGIAANGIIAVSSNYTVLSDDNKAVINADTTSSTIDISLPAPSNGFIITVKDIAGNSSVNRINVIATSGVSIDNVQNNDLIQENFHAVTYLSDGTKWYRIAKYENIAVV